MKCFFCKAQVNERRKTTYYTFVPRQNGKTKKVRWCQPCNESKTDLIDKFLKENQ